MRATRQEAAILVIALQVNPQQATAIALAIALMVLIAVIGARPLQERVPTPVLLPDMGKTFNRRAEFLTKIPF